MGPTTHLLPGQISAIEICTRTMSVLSLLGSCYIIITFLAFPFYRKAINRLVFYATWGNILANVATLISTSGIPIDPTRLSALCEFQGVLIQWFMMADSLWVFCMATNVFLVFWHGYDSQMLHHLEKWYFGFAYGIPAVPAITFVILDHHSQLRIIGPATLWCWVRKDVEWMRIAFFYGPVWIVVSATMTIYIATGIKIFRKGAHLRFFLKESQHASENRDSVLTVEAAGNPFAAGKNIIVTTQIQHDVQRQHRDSGCNPYEADQGSLNSYSSTHNLSNVNPHEETDVISSDNNRESRVSRDLRPSTDTRSAAPHQGEGQAKTGYKATAFATSSVGESIMLPLRPSSDATHHRGSHIKKAAGNDAALAYLKVAFLMFIALFVVWVPSTVNRLYQFNKDRPSFALNILSATVLPLQGAWNAIIYIYTTQHEWSRAYALIKSKLNGTAIVYSQPRGFFYKDTSTTSRVTRDLDPEIGLDDALEQGDHMHHNEQARPDSVVESKPDQIR
ncbi:hypothetical protein GQ44DRAFT_758395 [Phaeosphaeriaceae sp. PMI808]|nr:hypothetical protein GQ44DRAFT_758395 [Phaeosphaeriaceae sp. PMI808]